MNQGILPLAQTIYTLAKKAGLVTSGGFEDLFPEIKLLKTVKRDQLIKLLVLYSIDHQKGMMLDWKFSAEDVVFNVKSLLPEFDIQSLGEKQVSGDWFETIKVEGQEYSFIQEKAMVYEVVKPINSHLEKKGLAFITPANSDDNIYFLLVDLETVPQFEMLGFYLA